MERRMAEKFQAQIDQLNHRQPKLAVWVLEYFIDSLDIINEQVEMKTQIKKLVNKTLLTFYLLLLDVS